MIARRTDSHCSDANVSIKRFRERLKIRNIHSLWRTEVDIRCTGLIIFREAGIPKDQ